MTRPFVVPTVVVGALLWLSGFPEPPGGAVQAQPQQALQDVEYEAALNDGELALRGRRFEEALEAFKDANERRDKKSPQAFYGICRAQNGMADYGDAAKACENGLKYVGDDPWLEARLHHERGLALTARVTSNKDKLLREAEEEFRAVVQLTAEIPIAWFNLGVIAVRQGHDEEGIAAFQAYLDSGATGSEVELARELRDSPRRLREPVAQLPPIAT